MTNIDDSSKEHNSYSVQHSSDYDLTNTQDRFATATSLPPVDESQDWELIEGESEEGRILMTLERDFITCDERDIDITVSTTTNFSRRK